MQKRIVSRDAAVAATPGHIWLDMEKLATVELTSEADGFPIESALQPSDGRGWRSADAGEQTVRLLFDAPLRVRRVRLVFCEKEQSRTQEFVLRWSSDQGQTFREVVRQQFNFSAPDSTCEEEEYEVDLAGLTTLELSIIPDVGGGSGRASISQFRLSE